MMLFSVLKVVSSNPTVRDAFQSLLGFVSKQKFQVSSEKPNVDFFSTMCRGLTFIPSRMSLARMGFLVVFDSFWIVCLPPSLMHKQAVYLSLSLSHAHPYVCEHAHRHTHFLPHTIQ